MNLLKLPSSSGCRDSDQAVVVLSELGTSSADITPLAVERTHTQRCVPLLTPLR